MALKRTMYEDLGDAGLNTTGWGEVGDEFLREWQGAGEKAKRVREMLSNSPVVGALRLAVEMPIRAVEWQFVSDEGEDDPRLALLDDALAAMSHSWEDHITDALGFLWYGWSMFTITYQAVGGRVLWRKFRPLAPDTLMKWLFAPDGGMAGIQQWPHLWLDPIPIERMVVYRFRRARGNPEGESILRPAWGPWYYVKNLQQTEAIGIERDLAGLPVMTLPENADTNDISDPATDAGRAWQIVSNVRRDEMAGLVLPFGWQFNLVSAAGSGRVDTDTVINRYNKQILMAGLSQFLALGMENIGALATFQGGSDFFTLTLNAVADVIAETFTTFAVRRLLELNGYDPHGVRLEHGPVGDVQPAAIADALSKLVAAGALTLTAADEVWLRGLFRLPPRDVDEIAADRDVTAAAAQATAEVMRDAMRRRTADGATAEQTAELQADTYAAVDDAADAYRSQMERRWQQKMSAFLTRQGRDVVRQARKDHATPQ